MRKFKVGDRVVLCGQQDNGYIGDVGTIIKDNNTPGAAYGVLFDNERRGVYHCNVTFDLNNKDREYWVLEKNLCFVKNFKKLSYVRCNRCGKMISKSLSNRSNNGDYYCKDCSEIKPYHTKNNEKIHKSNNKNKTYGFELECVPKNRACYLNMLNKKYSLIPTRDSSLPDDGVEFKTPTYQSLRGLYQNFNSFYKWVDFSNQKCGQHINIGDSEYLNQESMEKILKYSDYIFDCLKEYMYENRKLTESVCGRFFTKYASCTVSYAEHTSWINLSHEDRIEFRLSKFVTPIQYIILTKMWAEMLDCIINNFLKKYNDKSYRNLKNAKNTSIKLVKIFKKYAKIC